MRTEEELREGLKSMERALRAPLLTKSVKHRLSGAKAYALWVLAEKGSVKEMSESITKDMR